MEVSAKMVGAQISPQKMRLVVDQVRGMCIERASDILLYSNKKAAVMVKKLLSSAISNAENNHGLDIDELKISEIYVGAGSTLKRIKARAKGRSNRILKRSCNVTIKLSPTAKEE